ncbi:MAG TPA: phosphodiesterase [Eubacterium sp.]|nr:phosphodiesterase [Lachnospiraceae bacterium]HAZ90607.1 phosphodiesterase [Eubacterium sp.]HBZ53583.1 phosphodiesterase [Eubacterium sp.]
MRLLIASDIHGSIRYMEHLVKRIEEEKPSKILLLGDLLYHGPRNDLPSGYDTKAVAVRLNSLKDDIICVRGNCDSDVDQMVLDFPIMADYAIVSEGDMNIYASHGHIHGEKSSLCHDGGIMLCGHTHVPKVAEYEDYTYINPGSVSIPKEGSHHGYIMMENHRFVFKDVETGLETGLIYEWKRKDRNI